MIALPPNTRLTILDLDGTLAVMPIDWRGMKRALAEAFRDTAFATLSEAVREVTRRHGAAGRERCFDIIRSFEAASLPATTGVPDALELIDAHRGRTQLAICSNNMHATIEDVVLALGLAGAFSVVLGRDDVLEPKPAPEGLLRILSQLQVRARDAVFVGNLESDERAGAGAGISTIIMAPEPRWCAPTTSTAGG